MTNVSFSQNDPIIGESFWQKFSLVTLIFFELGMLILIFCQFANFGNQSLLYISYYSCRYKSTSNAEQHFFPSSLAFNFMCLLDFGLIHAAHLGFQRKVLLELRSQGKDDLVEPNALYSVCLLAGNYFLHLIFFF